MSEIDQDFFFMHVFLGSMFNDKEEIGRLNGTSLMDSPLELQLINSYWAFLVQNETQYNNKLYAGRAQWTRTFICELLKRLIHFPTLRFMFVLDELHLPPLQLRLDVTTSEGRLQTPPSVCRHTSLSVSHVSRFLSIKSSLF